MQPGSTGPGCFAFFGALLLAAAPLGAEETPVLDLAIELARRDHPDLDEKEVRAAIDRLVNRYESLAREDPDAAKSVDALRRALFPEPPAGFAAVTELDSSTTLHIDTVLERRKGYCLSLSVIALAVAERTGAPLHGVAAPNHFFVRYDDGTFSRNLELTRGGMEIPDNKWREIVGDLPDDSIYLRNLRPGELRAFLLHNRGFVALNRKRYREARADFEEAIRLMPGLAEAHRNLGVLHGEKKRWGQAKRSLAKALALLPRDTDALVNLAICRRALGEKQAARQDLEMVLALDPENTRAKELLQEWANQPAKRILVGEPLPEPPPGLKQGLLGRYFAGPNFQTLSKERIDQQLDFDWQNAAPLAGLPRDRFSVRWEGYFKAPRSGTYTFFLAANDGCRLVLGKKTLLENWKNMGYRNWYGSKEVRLPAGWHRIRVEHFDAMGGARLLLRIGLDGVDAPLPQKEHLFHTKTKE